MGAFGFLLLTVLSASVGGATGACRPVKNEDMIEYACEGGDVSDLNALPKTTGKLRISNMPIYRITAETFSRFGSDLWVLGCSHCGIMDIAPDAFEQLDSLEQLSLDSNRLTTIRETWFRGLDYLTFLDLNYNDIQTIEEGVFANIPGLVDLRLSGNRLECLNLKDMSKLTELRRMFLSENTEFKCPNAVSKFLENKGVAFERDPEWRRLPSDLVAVEVPVEHETTVWTTTAIPTTSTPVYRERYRPSSAPTEDTRTTYSRQHPYEEVITPDRQPDLEPSEPPMPTYYERPTARPATPTWHYVNTMGPYDPPKIDSTAATATYPQYMDPQSVPTAPTATYPQYMDPQTVPTAPTATYPQYMDPQTVPTAPTATYPQYMDPETVPTAPTATYRTYMPQQTVSTVATMTYPVYVPPKTVRPADTMTYPPYVAMVNNLDTSTLRSAIVIPEWETSVDSDGEAYPPHENENDSYEEPSYSGEATWPLSLAPSPIDDREMPPFVEPDVEHTTDPYRMYWSADHDRSSLGTYPIDNGQVTHPTEAPNRMAGHVVRPLPPAAPEIYQPASADDFFQAPYYEPTVTVHPPAGNYQQHQEETTPGVLDIETTTTDKPLPVCPSSSSASAMARSFQMIVISILLVAMKNMVLVEGF